MKRFHLFIFLSLVLSLCLSCSVLILKPLKPFLPYLDYLLGTQKPTSYLILLGNDTEIRANGGFVGSYAKLTASFPDYELSFQDIYVPNGQLKGYVTPPPPVQEAFQNGSWELANADWDPDFASAATAIRWFMEKGGEINPDNLVLLNLTTIRNILKEIGSFQVPEYGAEINPDNLYLFLQGKAELNFFPGSTQKKDALTAVGHALKKHLINLPLSKKITVFKILISDLKNQNIVINSANPNFQRLLVDKNYAGTLSSQSLDTYLLIETNLGANKANAYITRKTEHQIAVLDGRITHRVVLSLYNSSPNSNPNPPFHYGGDYIAYLRFYLPPNAENLKIDRETTNPNKLQPVTIDQNHGLTELGLWLITPAQNQTTVSVYYTIPTNSPKYSLSIIKQHGLVSSPQILLINGKNHSTELKNDFFFKL